MKRVFFLLTLAVLLIGCGAASQNELTVGEIIKRDTSITWSTFMGDNSMTCSIPEYLDYVAPGGMSLCDYDFYYTYLDVDGDGERDVVVVDPKYPIEFVIIEREHKYYGGALHGRQAQRMFTNGYILSSDGGGYECYYQIRVDKMGEFICEDLAIRTDDIPQRYLIHGDEVTEQEYETWIKENCKEGIKFEHYEEEASSIDATE